MEPNSGLFRSSGQGRGFFWIGVFFLLAFLDLAFVASPGDVVAVWRVVFVLVGMAGFAYLFWLGRSIGVRASATGVVVRNFLSSVSVRWDEVDHFEMPTTWPCIAQLHMKGGRSVRIWGIAATRMNRTESVRKCQTLVDDLNHLRP